MKHPPEQFRTCKQVRNKGLVCKSVYCDRPAIRRFMCSKHYARWRSGGDINKKSQVEKTTEEKFWGNVKKLDDCWVWTAGVTDCGYGRMRAGKKNVCAHRMSWIINKGPIPDGLIVCHHCDNPPCVNPDHLFLGTFKDNTRDMIEKGRNPKGADFNKSGLCDLDVVVIKEIVRDGGSRKLVADFFGVSSSLVSQIYKGEIWKHIQLAD